MRASLAALLIPLALVASGSPTVVAKIETGGAQPCGSAAFGKYLYLDDYGSGRLLRIDPRTNKVVKRLQVGSGPCGVVAGGGALWVEDY